MNVIKMITRTGEPSKLDTAEYGTICKVINNLGIIYYVQLNKDSDNPTWSFIDAKNDDEALDKTKDIN